MVRGRRDEEERRTIVLWRVVAGVVVVLGLDVDGAREEVVVHATPESYLVWLDLNLKNWHKMSGELLGISAQWGRTD